MKAEEAKAAEEVEKMNNAGPRGEQRDVVGEA